MHLKRAIIQTMRTATIDPYGNRTQMTFGVQLLLILNIAAYIIEYFFRFPLSYFCALRSEWWTFFGVWQLFTYQFIHQGLGHLLANLLGLFFLGPETERSLGTNRFFILYFLSGILGGLGWSLLSPPGIVCVGASGAVFGVLGAYAALYPKRELILIFLPFMPIKAWIFVLMLGAYEFMHTLAGAGSRIANAAHLGGGIAGFVYALVISRPNILHNIRRKFISRPNPPADHEEIDRILDKAARDGMHTLSRRERDLLKRAGKQ